MAQDLLGQRYRLVLRLSTFRPLLAANWAPVTTSFGFISANLFLYLGRPGRITNGRLYGSVNLCLMIGTVYYGVFSLLEIQRIQSRPLAHQWQRPPYFSLITLTAPGYGDIVPLSHQARVFAALESVTGVLCIAITVARLVAAYKTTDHDHG